MKFQEGRFEIGPKGEELCILEVKHGKYLTRLRVDGKYDFFFTAKGGRFDGVGMVMGEGMFLFPEE
jgi:hypothetical protein